MRECCDELPFSLDESDRGVRRIVCSVLALWGRKGKLEDWYDVPAVSREWASMFEAVRWIAVTTWPKKLSISLAGALCLTAAAPVAGPWGASLLQHLFVRKTTR